MANVFVMRPETEILRVKSGPRFTRARPMMYDAYTVCRCEGTIVNLRVPRIFGPYEVARRLLHDLVFLTVPKGSSVFCENREGPVLGPAVCLVRDDKLYQVERAPVSDGDAYRLFKTCGI